MNSEEKNMPGGTFRNGVSKGQQRERPNIVLGTTVTPIIYDKLVAFGKEHGLKDQEVVRLAIAKLVSQF